MPNKFFKSVPRTSTYEHPLKDRESELVVVSPAIDLSGYIRDLVINPSTVPNGRQDKWNAENAIRLQELYNSLNYVQMERRAQELRSVFPPAVLHRIYFGRNEDTDFQAYLDSRPESGFTYWWTSPETQQRYQQACSALAVREEDLNAGKLEGSDINIPDEFVCPLSAHIMTTPVYDPRYPQQARCELLVMKVWLDQEHTNPFNREILSADDLVCDEALKSRIDDFVARNARLVSQPGRA